MRKLGLYLFILSLCVFVSTLSMSSYKLTDQVLVEQFGSQLNGKGENYADLLREPLREMMNKEYSSKFSFIADYKRIIETYNQPYQEKSDWDHYLNDIQLVQIVKHSSTGILADKNGVLIFFFISFVLTCIGALIFIFSGYSGETEGIKNNGIYHSSATNKGIIGIVVGVFLIAFYIVLYWFPEYMTNWMLLVDPLKKAFNGGEADQWFLYGFIYCLAMTIMGIRMLLKYRGNRYQQFRTYSVMFFQLCFAFIIPELMAALNGPVSHFGKDLKNIWPLDFTFFYDYNLQKYMDNGTIGYFFFAWGILLFAIGVPLFTYLYGKRWYCSWVCGCGGLAETAGDPYRQLSDKSVKAWKFERYIIHGVLVFAVLMTILTITSYITKSETVLGISTGFVRQIYGFMIGSAFAGVIGTGFYPLLGNRAWCRFGCPLAAYIGLVQRFKSRFRITTNGGQCISCGNCSTYCEMGIDVRWYAQRGQNIVRSSCVGCGVCSSVCPRGVLRLENGPEEGRINDNPIIIGNDGIRLNTSINHES